MEDDLVFPRVFGAQISEPIVPARFGADHFEAGDDAPELVGELQVCDVDHNASKRPYAHVFVLLFDPDSPVFQGFQLQHIPNGTHNESSIGRVVNKISPTTYGLLGLLAVRSWTGYELTHQLRRSLRYVWSSSEGHLYREQKRLVEMGWATVEDEAAGQRTRQRYTVTQSGRVALSEWLASEPEEPHFEIEGVLRLFYADQGSTADLTASMEATAQAARKMLGEMVDIVDEYLGDGGPLSMLEQGVGGPLQERVEYNGRPQYPERLHVIALVIDITTRLLAELDEFFNTTAEETRTWADTTEPQLTPATRRRLESISARHSNTRGV